MLQKPEELGGSPDEREEVINNGGALDKIISLKQWCPFFSPSRLADSCWSSRGVDLSDLCVTSFPHKTNGVWNVPQTGGKHGTDLRQLLSGVALLAGFTLPGAVRVLLLPALPGLLLAPGGNLRGAVTDGS